MNARSAPKGAPETVITRVQDQFTATSRHPGDLLFRDLPEFQRAQIERGWRHQPADAELLFDGITDNARWEIMCGLEDRTGDHAADVARITENADPMTNQAFDALFKEAVGDDGAAILSRVYDYLGRFVAYPSEAAHVAHALWVAHAHRMDAWCSTPRIAFLSPEPGSGKTRALEVTEFLVPRPVLAVNTTPSYLFRKVSDEAGPPTILYDEIDTVFGPKAKDNEDIRGLLNAGHRKGAVAGRCVVRGTTVMTEELPAYCAVGLAGLHDLPDTIRTRSVIVRMRRRAPDETVEPFRPRQHQAEGHALRDELAEWTAGAIEAGAWPTLPNTVVDRNADVWEPLIVVADAAGGEWPVRARDAAVALVADVAQSAPGLGVLLLADIRSVFDAIGEDMVSTQTLLEHLNGMEEAPWGNLRGHELDSRGLAKRLQPYEVRSKNIRTGAGVVKGYARADLFDAWSRYLLPSPEKTATTATEPTALVETAFGVADGERVAATSSATGSAGATANVPPTSTVAGVADVTDFQERGRRDSA
jgi:hypothetical protein